MSHKCPSCGSAQTASITVAQARETHHGSFGGIGVDTGGDLGVFGGKTSTTTAFGKTLSATHIEADKRSQLLPTIFIVAGGFVAFVFFFRSGEKSAAAAGALIVAVVSTVFAIAGFFWFLANASFNKTAAGIEAGYQARERAKWAKLWVCYQCGMKFEPGKAVV